MKNNKTDLRRRDVYVDGVLVAVVFESDLPYQTVENYRPPIPRPRRLHRLGYWILRRLDGLVPKLVDWIEESRSNY